MTNSRQVIRAVISFALLFAFASQALANFRIPNFSSNTYREIYKGEKPSSELPYWHGFMLKNSIANEASQFNLWDEFLYKQISQAHNLTSTVPHGISKFCPRYTSLSREQRILFWARLISIVASYESNYDPNTTFNEPTMPGVKSTGLLQISTFSALLPEYDCKMIGDFHDHNWKKTSAHNLKDPLKNLACGVRIMDYWIGEDKTMVSVDRNGDEWKGLARYWGTFRHPMLKDDPDGFWNAVDLRRPNWQRESRERDHKMMTAIREAREKNETWGNHEWRARSFAPHPSVLDYMFEKKESHRLTSILRLSNQTAFCF